MVGLNLWIKLIVLIGGVAHVTADARQCCFKYSGSCTQHDEWSGARDDSDWAYDNLDVGRNRDKCLARAREYFEWCGNTPEQPVKMVHVPTGAWAVYPPHEVLGDHHARENARLWEVSNMFRKSAAQYSISGSLGADLAKHGIGASEGSRVSFIDLVKHLYSAEHRNLSHAAAISEANLVDPNVAFLNATLHGAWNREGIATDERSFRLLEDCAWRGMNSLCHMALGYRHWYGIGAPTSCEKAAIHYRLASDMTLAFISMDGAPFQVHDVRLSQPVEVAKEQVHEAKIEMEREKAARGDAIAGVAVAVEEQFRDRDVNRAAALYADAAEKGDTFALNNLGAMLLNGLGGLDKDEAMAFKCFSQSAEWVNPWGMFNLAICYLYGHGVAVNHTKAFEWLHKAAEWKNSAAHRTLAMRYKDGHGVGRDLNKAYYHFDQAATYGDVDALLFLGVMLLDGEAFEPNCRVATRALKLASESGPWAQLLKEGYDSFNAGDAVGAALRYRLAAEAGYRTAQANVGWLLEQGVASLSPPNYPAALRFYQLAAQQGDVPSGRRIGDLYFEGRASGKPDYERALETYAGYAQDAESVHSLAYMYEHGLGTPQNATHAMALYNKARLLGRKVGPRRNPAESEPSPYGGVASDMAMLSLSFKEAARAAAGAVASALGLGSASPPPPPQIEEGKQHTEL